MAVQTEIIKEKVPAALLAPLPAGWTKPITTTGDFVARGDQESAARRVCYARIDAIRKWNSGTAAAVVPLK